MEKKPINLKLVIKMLTFHLNFVLKAYLINIDSEEVLFKENVYHFLITCDGIDKSNICRVLSSQVR